MPADIYTEDGYFAILPEWVLDADISALAVRLYAVLRRYADQRSLHAHPSRRTLADRLRVSSLRTVDSALDELVRLGAVQIFDRQRPDGGRAASGYVVRATPPPVQQIAGAPMQQVAGAPMQPAAQAPMQHTAHQELKPEEPEPEEQPLPLPLPLPGEEEAPPPAAAPPSRPAAAGFDEFWRAYPKKQGKDAARRAWARAVKRADPDKILAVCRRYPFETAPERQQFVKHPATWLNKGCWEDDLEAIAAENAARSRTSSNGHRPWQNPPPESYRMPASGKFV